MAAMSRLRTAIEVGPPPVPTPASRPSPDSGFRSGAGASVGHRPFAASTRLAVLPPGERERRRARPDRRRADRRVEDQGSPYGAERRSGSDDRQGDRRGGATAAAGIGLTRDYFAQPAHAAAPDEPVVPEALLVRFDG